MRVKQFHVKNQFVIEADEGTFFQSYDSTIAFVDNERKIYLDKEYWNYSVTTSKYRNKFLGLTTAETKKMIADGAIKMVDLN